MKSSEIKNKQLSDNERFKEESNYLRGSIFEDLGDSITGGFSPDNSQLIRFHGMYQQDDRDLRIERKKQKLEPLISMMLRARLPGGIISTSQWLKIDSFASQHTLYGSIRLTSRQTFQLHGLLKTKLKNAHQILNQVGLDSLATAGDVNRNVLCTSNPVDSNVHLQAYEWAKKISEHLLPQTRAYAEIWLDQEKISTEDSEPILGKTYLPRKFKTAVVIPPLNDVDMHANDLIFVAIQENTELIGFNVLVGGGLAMTHGDTNTYPRLASALGFIQASDTLKIARAVVEAQRDLGDRSNRKQAKTKYTIERIGLQSFKDEVEKRAHLSFMPVRNMEFTRRGDDFGWKKGIDGNWHLTLFIENGRILDFIDRPIKTGLAEIAKIHSGDFRLTANQNLIVAKVPDSLKDSIQSLVERYKLIDPKTSFQKEQSMACVSFPTCPLAMAEAERFLPNFLGKIEKILGKYDLQSDAFVLRVSGCPNGCSRPMLSEVAMVGKAINRYNLYLGGDFIGTRIPRLYKENVSSEEILQILEPMIKSWSKERNENERFGDFLIRTSVIEPVMDSAKDFHKKPKQLV